MVLFHVVTTKKGDNTTFPKLIHTASVSFIFKEKYDEECDVVV